MDNVLLVAYLLIVLAMIAVILIQRSEGGGLGMGGGTNSFMTTRGSANVLTRTTGILAALFFMLAISLTVVKSIDRGTTGILNSATQQTQTTNTNAPGTGQTGTGQTQPTNVLDALNQLQNQTSGASTGTTTNTTPETTTAPTTSTTTTTTTTTTAPTTPTTTSTTPTTTAPATDTPAPATDTPALALPNAPATGTTSGSGN